MPHYLQRFCNNRNDYIGLEDFPQEARNNKPALPLSHNGHQSRSSRFFETIPWYGLFITALLLAFIIATMVIYQNVGNGNLRSDQKTGFNVIITGLILLLSLSFLVSGAGGR